MTLAHIHHGREPDIELYTPEWIFRALGVRFDLDPCAPKKRCPSKRWCKSFYTSNGLTKEWTGKVFLNPPWTRGEKKKWVEKLSAHGNGVALVRGGIDSSWLHRNVPLALFMFNKRVRYLRSDGHFNRSDGIQPSMLLFYDWKTYYEAETGGIRKFGTFFRSVRPT